MPNPWLPTWVVVVFAAVFVVIMLLHVQHVVEMGSPRRWWHGGHVLMAAAMLVMLVPIGGLPAVGPLGSSVCAAAAAGLGGSRLVLHRPAPRSLLWPLLVVDLLAMAYMFAMEAVGTAWLTLPLVAWFVLQAWGWFGGGLFPMVAALGAADPPAARGASNTPVGQVPAVVRALPGTGDLALRISLATMATGMAYMLLAMQFGMSMGA
ncbi:DUF5134 domain-containing protein [Pseudonocardia sp. MH-G8]|uniref:DUF5134 domain-containing protein n=1 Tax=Pseudonocardia sp. MH-G8 TaxID=1854588 RepID=UPI000BA0ABEB|nr:DUF5134 domain-containing protein [Pseudonocardia sp. MH-G8]